MAKSERRFGLTQEYLRERFCYDGEGDEERGYGRFIRVAGRFNSKFGFWEWSKGRGGYRILRLSINGRQRVYTIHRLIWIYFFGDIPDEMEVDHINRNRLDNRIENLRVCSRRENMMNSKRNRSGFPGISWDKINNKWVSQIQINKVMTNLGRYNTLEEAVEARRNAERELGIEVREEFYRAS